jgi:hypothetical protein
MGVVKPFAILKSVSGDLERDCEVVKVIYADSREKAAQDLIKWLTDEGLPCTGSTSDVYVIVEMDVVARSSVKGLWHSHLLRAALASK